MFDTVELSRFSGKPIHLFVIRRQGLTLRYASGDRDVVVGEHTYVGANISRGEIRQGAESAKDKLKITFPCALNPAAPEFPSTQTLANLCRPYLPSDPISVVCLATHYGDTDPPIVEWMGVATQPSFTDTECELTCEPNPGGTAVNQGMTWQRTCPKAAYSTGPRGCNLDPEDFKVPAELTDVAGLTLKAAEFATAPLNLEGGEWVWTRLVDGVPIEESRFIMRHAGDTIQVLNGGYGLEEGLTGYALPNCPGTWAACGARREDPQLHYGGAIYEPIKNPHDGVSMSWG